MKLPLHERRYLLILLALVICISCVHAANVVVGSGQIASVGQTTTINVTLDSAPQGLRFYAMNFTVSNPAIANITGVTFPSWASLNNYSSLPGSTVSIRAGDLGGHIVAGSTNVNLVNLTLTGLAPGSSNLIISSNADMEDLNGNKITATSEYGVITVSGSSPGSDFGYFVMLVNVDGSAVTLQGADLKDYYAGVTKNGGIKIKVSTTAIQFIAYSVTHDGYQPFSDSIASMPLANQTITYNVTLVPGTATPTSTTTGTSTPTTSPTVTTTTTVPTLTPTVPAPGGGGLAVTSLPLDATVSVDGNVMGVTPLYVKALTRGAHTVEISKSGYYSWQQYVVINSNRITRIPMVLLKPSYKPGPNPIQGKGTIVVSSNPSGADVFVDGVFQGLTPIGVGNLAPGVHFIQVKKDGYNEYSSPAVIQYSGSIIYFPLIILSPATSGSFITSSSGAQSLQLSSDPSGADISMDGEPAGKTPITVNGLGQGPHIIQFHESGYNDQSSVAFVNGNDTTIIKPVKLAPADNGTVNSRSDLLYVDSLPQGALVSFDALPRGESPLNIEGILPGPHTLTFKLPGYEDYETLVIVKEGQVPEVPIVVLTPNVINGTHLAQSAVAVNSKPEGAEVYLNGTKLGETPLLIDGFADGSHPLQLKLEGYLDYNATIEKNDGVSEDIPTMMLIPSPDRDATPGMDFTTVKSMPSGANVFLDGLMAGTTPVLLQNLTPGTHYLEVKLDGYNDYTGMLDVKEGSTPDVPLILLIPSGTQGSEMTYSILNS